MNKLVSKIANQGSNGLIAILLTGGITTYGTTYIYNSVKQELVRRGESEESIKSNINLFLNIMSSFINQLEAK